ncbi:subtype B tannase [Pectinatus brassicae]|uniref:BD-FAE-like domain-containing protein n=1 Tax=Pectinatus brassicae TaxID=862415 RepID=A0A840UVP7_9FIRM|nr:subtype B tannase [Pectinatus brassicae]MBB5336515.1 hypothetical protein [Pectinatus brassicae]
MKLKKYIINGLAVSALSVTFTGQIAMAATSDQAVLNVKNIPSMNTTADNMDNLLKPQTANTNNMVIKKTYSLVFDAKKYTEETLTLNNKVIKYRAYRNMVYAAHPKNAQYESMNIFIPEAYFNNGTINDYKAKTAPIFMPNNVGGYMPGKAGEPSAHDRMSGTANAALVALSKGYVVAAPAIRGRTTIGSDGKTYVGKAPAFIVDYKAAVRYLRYNKKRLPAGDTEKIISDGTSAGGALSALLGATGNSKDFAPYLKEIGAANERDDIFASVDYCPITNLEHADMAYEWVFNGVNTYHQRMMPPMPNKLNADVKMNRPGNAPPDISTALLMTNKEIIVSGELKQLFPAYLNSLKLKDKNGKILTLDAAGNGSFKNYLESYYMASAQSALDKGEDLSKLDWLTIKNGKVTAMDLNKYAAYATRLKAAPAFDKLDLSSGENDEFGTINNIPRHFTVYSMKKTAADTAKMADKKEIKMLNPMNYIDAGKASVAPHWRIRHGAVDRDTSLAIPLILATKLMDNGYDVDFFSPWGKGHAGDYDLDKLFDWTDNICKKSL